MTAIGDYSDVLNDNMIAAWPRVAAALEGLDCALMGGTAVAMVLRHRHSHDLDFMTLQPFDSRAVAAKLLSSAARAAYKDDDRPHIAKVAFDGVPVTVMRDLRGFVEGHATQLADPSVVDGIAVGSVPDLMATKLDVIQHRRQGRDYIDIAAMDRAGACTIEDGLRYHKQRYAPTVTYEETLRIAQLATSPPPTDPDPAFDRHLTQAASAVSTNVCRFELARDRCNHRPNESNRRARRLLDTALATSPHAGAPSSTGHSSPGNGHAHRNPNPPHTNSDPPPRTRRRPVRHVALPPVPTPRSPGPRFPSTDCAGLWTT